MIILLISSLQLSSNSKLAEIDSLCKLAEMSLVRGKLDSANKYFQNALSIASFIDDIETINVINSLSKVLIRQTRYNEASEKLYKALEIAEKLQDSILLAKTNKSLAQLYFEQGNTEDAIKFLEIAEDYIGSQFTLLEEAECKMLFGKIYNRSREYDIALKYFTQSLDIKRSLPDSLRNNKLLVENYIEVGRLFKQKKEWSKSLDYLIVALSLSIAGNYSDLLIQVYIDIGDLYLNQDNQNDAMYYLKQAEEISNKSEDLSQKIKIAHLLSVSYKKSKDLSQALFYLEKEDNLKDSFFSVEKSRAVADALAKYNAEKKDMENEILKDKNQVQNQFNKFLLISISLIAIVLIVIVVLFNGNRKINRKLEEKNEEIQVKNNEIMSSIRYARDIQQSILPITADLNSKLVNTFVYYKPKDIVSGDFFWHYQRDLVHYFVVADCTGHGVPGAFISLLGINILNDIIAHKKNSDTSDIITKLNQRFIVAMKQNTDHPVANDGMDIALLKLDTKKGLFEYTGANRNLFVLSDTGFREMKGEKNSIGGRQKSTFYVYEKEKGKIEQGSNRFLLFSDGFVDQQNDRGKKFGTKKLRNTFRDSHKSNFDDFRSEIKTQFKKHKGEETQRDDVTLLVVEVNL